MKKVKLGDLGKIITGNTPSKKLSEFYNSNDIPFIKPDDFKTTDEISTSKGNKNYISENARNNARIVPQNSVLVTCIGIIGKVMISESELSFNQQINAIVPNELILSKYLAYLLLYNKPKLDFISNAPVVPIINKTQFSEFEVTFHEDIDVQEKIIQNLENLDNQILKRRHQSRLLLNLVKSRFNEMFGDIFDDPQSKLEDHTELNPNKKELLNFNGNVSFLPMSNVSENGKIDLSINRNIDDVRKGFTFFKDNDVIVAKITPCFENGKGAPVFGLLNGVGFGSTEFHVLRPKNTVNTVWLYHVTMLSKFRLEGEKKMTGSGGQRRITKDFINNFKLNIPPLYLQNEFADFVVQVDKSQLAIQKSLEELETLKKSLMQEYFG